VVVAVPRLRPVVCEGGQMADAKKLVTKEEQFKDTAEKYLSAEGAFQQAKAAVVKAGEVMQAASERLRLLEGDLRAFCGPSTPCRYVAIGDKLIVVREGSASVEPLVK